MNNEQPHLRRAWTTGSGGPRIRLESHSYITPNFTSHDDFDLPQNFNYEQPTRRPSLFRTAFQFLGAVHELHRERMEQQEDDTRSRRSDADRAGYCRSDARDKHSRSRSSRMGEPSERSYERSNRERSSSNRLHKKHRYDDGHEDSERHHYASSSTRRSAFLFLDNEFSAENLRIRRLENEIRNEEDEIAICLRYLANEAQREHASERMMQYYFSQLQEHEDCLRRAKSELRAALGARSREPQSAAGERRRPSTQNAGRGRPSQSLPPGLNNLFTFILTGAASHASTRDGPAFATHHTNLFDHIFAEMARDQPPPPMHGSGPSYFTYDFFNTQGFGGPGQQQATPQPQVRQPRPQQAMTTREAKELHQAYNTRWTSLAPTDPNVPYPGRNLQSAALLNRQAIYAPTVSSPVSTWSVEDVVRVNTQTFFLSVVGFVPQYTDILGKIVLDFKATPAQLQLLADMLKKEKLRWHSDKLGRRNGGQEGVNVTLQQHEVARAIFHAVCELSDLVAAKR